MNSFIKTFEDRMSPRSKSWLVILPFIEKANDPIPEEFVKLKFAWPEEPEMPINPVTFLPRKVSSFSQRANLTTGTDEPTTNRGILSDCTL